VIEANARRQLFGQADREGVERQIRIAPHRAEGQRDAALGGAMFPCSDLRERGGT
jgi:hypothetical protein